jgi:hypothetical protein
MFCQLPCLGVEWISNRSASRLAAAGGRAPPRAARCGCCVDPGPGRAALPGVVGAAATSTAHDRLVAWCRPGPPHAPRLRHRRCAHRPGPASCAPAPPPPRRSRTPAARPQRCPGGRPWRRRWPRRSSPARPPLGWLRAGRAREQPGTFACHQRDGMLALTHAGLRRGGHRPDRQTLPPRRRPRKSPVTVH